MKTLLLFVVLAMVTLPTMQQTCPQDPRVGNPINYVHLFKEQTDSDFDFYNTKTTFSLVFQDNTVQTTNNVTTGSRQRIVIRITNSNLPVRSWLYITNIRYDTNNFIFQIDQSAKIRSTGVAATDLALIQAFFADPTIVVAGAPGTCCLAKLEYIYFYYLFTNYYKNGLGLSQPLCG